jgi:RNase P/RNase MRP subunit p29
MLRQPDEVASFGESRFATDTTVIDIRVTEVAEPRPGDRIDIDGELLLVQGEPRRDAERLVWRIEAVPA